jgi:hypothetical protein
LAVKGKMLGRKLLAQVGSLVSPDTILRWHRLLVAKSLRGAFADPLLIIGRDALRTRQGCSVISTSCPCFIFFILRTLPVRSQMGRRSDFGFYRERRLSPYQSTA